MKQLKVEEFTEFGSPVQDCIRIAGRIVNLTTEEGNLTPEQCGLLNFGDDNSTTQVYKLKLNLSEIKNFNLFEGEVIACEGFNDTNARFNVNRIFKPLPDPKPLYDFSFLHKYREAQHSRALQVVVAAGPFTTGDSLAYDALADLLETVRRDKPHTLILMGPFLDVANQAIESGDISFKNPTSQTIHFMDYDELFHTLLSYVQSELEADKLSTKVVLVPSHKEVHHPYPMPCPPFKDS